MKISACEQVQRWLSGLSPESKRQLRAALRGLEHSERNLDVKAFRGELEGFHRLRVGGYRIVYHYGAGQIVYLDYADLRDEVYEAFKRLRTLRESGEEPQPQ
jgi:mRNA-degrading endonuclease RelE of RelBE toxin-antitoxin system